ncbi:MAG: formylmethanofuran dehydrogenase [Candidatus Methanoperedenaceae archaeon HGW-Methanoperedenaceae-1]|nr:MAG: formylmethanofuran dehydrogenase [Candidatus Methanoperedenaceae archaeon HGW-Methanoperedenaceae-1]
MDVGKFLKNPEYDIRITTYRDVFQMAALEHDRWGDEYMKHSAAVFMSKLDMKKMGFKKGERVKLSNAQGSIVVDVRETKRDEPGGIAFMVNSLWSNALVSGDTGGKGIPEFKDIRAKVSLSKDEVTTVEKLVSVK